MIVILKLGIAAILTLGFLFLGSIKTSNHPDTPKVGLCQDGTDKMCD